MEQTRVPRHEETADYWRAMHDEQVAKKQNLHERYVDLHDEVDRLRRENGRLLSELRHHATYDDRPCQSCQAILIEVGG